MSTTDKLTDVLKKAKPEDLTAYFEEHWESIIQEERPFATFMRMLLREKGLKQQELFVLADIPERYGYRLISEERHTKQRDIILRFCIGGKFSLDETQKALRLAGFPILYPKLPRDAVLMVAVNRSIGDVHAVDSLLTEHGLETLAPCGQ